MEFTLTLTPDPSHSYMSHIPTVLCGNSSGRLKLVINPQHACAGGLHVVGSVCVSVKSHLTSRSALSVRPENTVTYSAGNGGQKKICGVFSDTAPVEIQHCSVESHTYGWAFFC